MIPNSGIDSLAKELRERREAMSPYILLLGEGCAAAAGAPSRVDIAREALRAFDPLGGLIGQSDEDVFLRFANHTRSLVPAQLGRMLKGLYSRVAVPSFYQDLALLIRERYFPLIATLNFDTLLEQALARVGVTPAECRVTTFDRRGAVSNWQDRGGAPLVHIVKLHGDLAQDAVQLAPGQIQEALDASRRWISSDLIGDLIIVGHTLSDSPIERWLAQSTDRELWWVNDAHPSDLSRIQSWTRGNVQEITGDLGKPQVFFTQLALRLLRAVDEEQQQPEEHAAPAALLSGTLRNEIVRGYSMLYNLEQQITAGDASPQVQAQIVYQKRHISEIEDRLRAQPEVRPALLACVRNIGVALRRASGGEIGDRAAGMIDFIDAQTKTLESEFAKDSPNQFLVSASLGGVLTLADRLVTEYESRVVDPDDVKQLAALAPSAASKVVLP